MPVPIPPATPSTPPVAPQRTEPTTFSARMDAWLAWFNASFWVWVYDLVPWIQARANETEAWSNTASASAAAASASQTTAEEAITVATTAMVTVTQQAAAAAATSGTISSVAAAASASASSASASSAAASVSAGRAIAAWAAAAAPIEQLAGMSQSLHVGTVVKSIIYDTSKDSDGGAWRKRMQDKSWYNETLGGNAWIGQQPSEAVARASVGSRASPELIVNGTFDTDTSGWTSYQGGILSVSSNRLLITNDGTGTNSGSAYQSFTTIVGRVYVFTYTSIAGTSGAATARVGTTIGGSTLATQSGIGTYTLTFTATTTSTFITLYTNDITASRTAFFDNISVKIVDPVILTADYLYQSTADGKFYKTVSTSGVSEVFRGISREFPAVVAIVAESARVVIYDLTQSGAPMWMVFLTTTGYALNSGTITSLAMLNGELYVGMINQPANVRFILDVAQRRNTSRHYRNTLNLAQRNAVGVWVEISDGSGAIVNGSVNDVAITVLDNAPIDPSTQLPVPTILVGTAGGLSIIKDNGSVVTVSFSDATFYSGFVDENKQLIVASDTSNRMGFIHVYPSIPSANVTQAATYVKGSFASEFYTGWPSTAYTGTDLAFTSGSATAGFADVEVAGDSFVRGSAQSLQRLHRNPSAPGKGMVAVCTTGYATGWQVGDSRLAILADTTAETISATDVVSNGSFTAGTTGWAAGGTATLSVESGELRVLGDGIGSFPNASQVLSLVVGKMYQLKFSITTANTLGIALAGEALYPATGSGFYYPNAIGDYVVYFTATAATRTLQLVANSSGAVGTNRFDNVSCNLCVADRSVKSRGLVVNGTLTKTAVASGAGLVAYSGFSASNYLEQPYNSDLDFGTGDFCVMGWVNLTGVGGTRFLSRTDKTGATFGTNSSFSLMLSAGNWYFQSVTGNWATGVAATTGLHFVVLTFSATSLKLYVDNALVASTTLALNITAAGSPSLLLGAGWYNGTIVDAVPGALALWRVSATAPSADQIAHIYRTELPLFQANAQCTIAGTSTAVTALAYDDVADELHVGTSWGRSEFKDLLRVASEATTTGSITSLSANEGVVINAGTSAKIYAPAMYLRDELRRTFTASKALAKQLMWQEFYATEGQTTFTCSKNGDVRAVYVNNILRKAPVDYTVSSDGFQNIITFTSGISAGIQVSVQTTRS